MSFCKISSQYLYSGQTIVDNIFVTSHLPNLDGDTVKVYLYGLYECTSGSGAGIETFSRVLGISEKKIWEAFEKLAKEGLVTIIEGYPKEVRYNPVTNKVKETKLYSREKYYNFNIQIQNIIRERMITPTEYKEYYLVIEAFNMEPDALVMIAKYATGIKGEKVGHAYITTLAKNWAREGCLTVEAVEKRLKQYEVLTGELKLLFDVLNIKKEPTVDDKTEYLNLKNQVALTLPEFFEIANRTKKTGSSFSKFVKTVLEHAEKGKGMASDIEKSEEIIRQIHDKIGRGEVISNQIRSLYRNWSYTLAMPDDVILYALSQSVAAGNPLLYLNRTLENWAEAGAKTLAAVKKQTPQVAQDKVVKEKEEQRTKTRTMKEEEIARIFKLRENKEFRDLDTKHRALVLEAAKLKSEGKNVKELEKEIAVLERKMENIKKKI